MLAYLENQVQKENKVFQVFQVSRGQKAIAVHLVPQDYKEHPEYTVLKVRRDIMDYLEKRDNQGYPVEMAKKAK